nr:MAG TPA: hypothetical protein [Caudoviricetes sp.]
MYISFYFIFRHILTCFALLFCYNIFTLHRKAVIV